TLWTTENSAVLAPMQSASVSAAVIENALSLPSSRSPTRRSFHIKDVDDCNRGDVLPGARRALIGRAAVVRRGSPAHDDQRRTRGARWPPFVISADSADSAISALYVVGGESA